MKSSFHVHWTLHSSGFLKPFTHSRGMPWIQCRQYFIQQSVHWASQEMADFYKHSVSCCSHSSCSRYNRLRPQSTYLQHHTGLTANTITAATSPMFGFPVLCSCCWGDPKPLFKAQSSSYTSCGAIAHNLWVILAQYSRRLEGVDQNLSRRCIT